MQGQRRWFWEALERMEETSNWGKVVPNTKYQGSIKNTSEQLAWGVPNIRSFNFVVRLWGVMVVHSPTILIPLLIKSPV